MDNEYFLSEVGESSKLETRVENYNKNDCFIKNCKGQFTVFVHYTPFLNQDGRIRIERELRELFHPDCEPENNLFST